jgi:hypothetical protein
LLSSWGIRFEGIDVEREPAAMQDLARVGVPRVPATIVGDRVVHGWNPAALADLVGVRHVEGERLTPAELARRLDGVLAAAERAVGQIPREDLGMKAPDRNRTVRQLGYHIFRLCEAFREARAANYLPETAYNDDPPADLADGPALARYGRRVRERLAAWVAEPGWCEGTVETYYGTQTAHDMMERTTWHAAQHLRQLYWFLDRMSVVPEGRLADDDLAPLPFPKEVWS